MPYIRQRKDGSWFVRWSETDPATGKRRQPIESGFPTEGAAKRWWSRHDADRQRLDGTARLGELTVAEYYPIWLRGYMSHPPSGRPPREATLHSIELHARLHILPHLGSYRLDRLSKVILRAWHQDLYDKGLAHSTVHRIHGRLSSMLKQAVEDGDLLRNSAASSWPLKARSELRFWSVEEIQAVLPYLEADRFGLLYKTILLTAMRLGEVLALRWANVDIQRSEISIVETESRTRDGGWTIAPPKSAASTRTISVPRSLMTELQRHRHAQIEHRLSYDERWHEHDLVFCAVNGLRQDRSAVRKHLKRRAQAAGVPEITLHGLRRTAATWMVFLNEHPRVIQERLGHESIETTMRLYALVSSQMDREAAQRLDNAMEAWRESVS